MCMLLPCCNTKELSSSGSSCWKDNPRLWHISRHREENVPLGDGGEDHRPSDELILVYLPMPTLVSAGGCRSLNMAMVRTTAIAGRIWQE